MAVGKDKLGYLRHKLETHDLEEIFEHFDLDPEEVLMFLNSAGHYDLDYFMDDEWFEEEEEDE